MISQVSAHGGKTRTRRLILPAPAKSSRILLPVRLILPVLAKSSRILLPVCYTVKKVLGMH